MWQDARRDRALQGVNYLPRVSRVGGGGGERERKRQTKRHHCHLPFLKPAPWAERSGPRYPCPENGTRVTPHHIPAIPESNRPHCAARLPSFTDFGTRIFRDLCAQPPKREQGSQLQLHGANTQQARRLGHRGQGANVCKLIQSSRGRGVRRVPGNKMTPLPRPGRARALTRRVPSDVWLVQRAHDARRFRSSVSGRVPGEWARRRPPRRQGNPTRIGSCLEATHTHPGFGIHDRPHPLPRGDEVMPDDGVTGVTHALVMRAGSLRRGNRAQRLAAVQWEASAGITGSGDTGDGVSDPTQWHAW